MTTQPYMNHVCTAQEISVELGIGRQAIGRSLRDTFEEVPAIKIKFNDSEQVIDIGAAIRLCDWMDTQISIAMENAKQSQKS
jgi:hypothetical protein